MSFISYKDAFNNIGKCIFAEEWSMHEIDTHQKQDIHYKRDIIGLDDLVKIPINQNELVYSTYVESMKLGCHLKYQNSILNKPMRDELGHIYYTNK